MMRIEKLIFLMSYLLILSGLSEAAHLASGEEAKKTATPVQTNDAWIAVPDLIKDHSFTGYWDHSPKPKPKTIDRHTHNPEIRWIQGPDGKLYEVSAECVEIGETPDGKYNNVPKDGFKWVENDDGTYSLAHKGSIDDIPRKPKGIL